ncbi:MAG: aminotransferase class V-fold PLP-dependent enzyme, partial [Actinomycetota bacterium]
PTRRRDEAKHLLELRQQIEEGFCAIDGVTLIDGGESERVSQTSCFTIAGVEAEPVLIGLERQGFAVHSGSACASESLEASPVLEAMGVDARHGLRISTGWDSSPEGVAGLIAAFGATVSQLRSLRS